MLTRLSIDTLIACAPILGGAPLEDRGYVRAAQEPGLLPEGLRAGLQIAGDGRPRFYYGCLDFLPFRAEGREGFQLLEFNGTGMGGLTNLPWEILNEVLEELAAMPAGLEAEAPLVVLPLSVEAKRGLVHERVLVAQAIAEGLQRSRGAGEVWLFRGPTGAAPRGPAVALGNPRVVKEALRTAEGRLMLDGRRVDATVRDLFCQHVADRHGDRLAPGAFHPVNAIFRLCASKPRTYALYNRCLAEGLTERLWRPVEHVTADSRDALVEVVRAARTEGRSLVIKPHASGAGRGVEFLQASASFEELVARVDAALEDAVRSLEGGPPRQVFPYVACELLEGLPVRDPAHRSAGCRHELRIVVYRRGDRLHVFPAVCKVAGQRYDPAAPSRAMLLNTVTVHEGAGGQLLPLCNAETLRAIGLPLAGLVELCEFSLRFVARAIAEA